MKVVELVKVALARRHLTALMRSVARRLVIAASSDCVLRMDPQSTSKDMLHRLELGGIDGGGVWCADGSIVLWRVLVEHGYAASIVSLGFFPGATHNGVLVRLGDLHYYYDCYFNFELALSFEDAVAKYIRTGTLKLKSGTTMRRHCYLSYPMNDDVHWWTYEGPRPTTFPAVCPIYFTIDQFAASPPNRWTWEPMEGLGLAPRIENLFLFPFAVFNQEHLYVDAPEASPLLAHLVSVTGCRGAERADAHGTCNIRGWHPSLLKVERAYAGSDRA
jgi:hypothetical protein